jgi:acetolactate synthase-1/2/3 large subunit
MSDFLLADTPPVGAPHQKAAPETATVGEIVAAFLEQCGVTAAFGVISIHNMPILDAVGRRQRMRFVPSRGEAGAVAMADAYARVHGGIGVAVTSTGTAAGNAGGAMVEAQTAGSPVLHLTGQIELAYLDRGRSYIHEAFDQPGLLRAVSKRFFRVWSPETALGTLKEAVRVALTSPTGPVSVEIPIDIQEARIPFPADLEPLTAPVALPSEAALDRLADALASKRRPLLWLGGGALGAAAEVSKLVELGFGIVTSTRGRGILPEDHPMTLGAFNGAPIEGFYRTCDAMLVVGSRLRGNETLKYTLKLPQPLYQIDVDPTADGRSYKTSLFVAGAAAPALAGLASRLASRFRPDPAFAGDLAATRERAESALKRSIAPYDRLVAALQATVPDNFVWVRDVTVANSMWGNKMMRLAGPHDGVHAMGGGIGLGLPMAIGAAVASENGGEGRKIVALSGDGGLQLCLGELGTLVQEKANVLLLVMNDLGYGVIRNIQDDRFGGRRYFADLTTPDFAALAASYGLPHRAIRSLDEAPAVLRAAMDVAGPVFVEVDMTAIGPVAEAFAGPPVRNA